jgi:hypothetical protein
MAGITIKGEFNVGEKLVTSFRPPTKKKKEIKSFHQLKNEIKTPVVEKKLKVEIMPVPVINKYHVVEEAELLKHFNTKSDYLSDMANLKEFK